MFSRLRASTQWDHYLRTQGGRLRDPLYNATTPTRRKVKKQRRYASTLEDRWEQELAALTQMPTTGHVTFFLLIIVHITDYHWDRHLYFVIHSHHAQTMTHTPPSDDSILILRLVVLVACDSD
jgi:hypothetical protein